MPSAVMILVSCLALSLVGLSRSEEGDDCGPMSHQETSYRHVTNTSLDFDLLEKYKVKQWDINMAEDKLGYRVGYIHITGRDIMGINFSWDDNGLCLRNWKLTRPLCVHPMDFWGEDPGVARLYHLKYNQDQATQDLVDDVFECLGKVLTNYYLLDVSCIRGLESPMASPRSSFRVIIGTTGIQKNKKPETWIAVIYGGDGTYLGQHYVEELGVVGRRFKWDLDAKDSRSIHVMSVSEHIAAKRGQMKYTKYQTVCRKRHPART